MATIDDLVERTGNLIEKVTDLTDVLMTQTDEIKQVRTDLSTKADRSTLRTAGLVVAVGVIVAAGTAFASASEFSASRAEEEQINRNRLGYAACLSTNTKNTVNVDTYRDFAKQLPVGSEAFTILNRSADTLQKENRDCEAVYPRKGRE